MDKVLSGGEERERILHVKRTVWTEASLGKLWEGQCGRNTGIWTFLHWPHRPLHLVLFFLPPSQPNFNEESSSYTASCSSASTHSSNHSNLSSRLSSILKLLLLRQPTSMLANQRNILLSLYYLASQQYPEVSHSFLGQSLFLVSLTSHILVFFRLLLQCLLLDLFINKYDNTWQVLTIVHSK